MTQSMLRSRVLLLLSSLDKYECRDIFFDVLRNAGVTSKSTLEEKIEGLQEMTTGDRKQFFSEYQAQAAKREKEEARVQKQKAREEFRQLLDHWGEDGELDPDISFRQIASACHAMGFWALLDADELGDIFQDFLSSYESNSRHLIKERRHERKRELFRLFEERWSSTPNIPSWEEAQLLLSQNPSVVTGLDLLDRFEVFEDYAIEKFEKRREDKRRRDRREGRKARDSFVALVETCKDQIVRPGSEPMHWTEFQPLIKNRSEYVDLIGTRNSSQPYDLFAELRSKWKHGFETSLKRSLSKDSQDSDRKRLK